MDKFDRDFAAELRSFCQKINQEIKVEGMTDSHRKTFKQIEERWTVYRFSLPPTTTKIIAIGFDSKDSAKEFINQRLKKQEITIEKDDGTLIHIKHDVIRESREEVDVYYNEDIITTVGNNHQDVLTRWFN